MLLLVGSVLISHIWKALVNLSHCIMLFQIATISLSYSLKLMTV